MTIGHVVTAGYGNGTFEGDTRFVVTRGYGNFEDVLMSDTAQGIAVACYRPAGGSVRAYPPFIWARNDSLEGNELAYAVDCSSLIPEGMLYKSVKAFSVEPPNVQITAIDINTQDVTDFEGHTIPRAKGFMFVKGPQSIKGDGELAVVLSTDGGSLIGVTVPFSVL